MLCLVLLRVGMCRCAWGEVLTERGKAAAGESCVVLPSSPEDEEVIKVMMSYQPSTLNGEKKTIQWIGFISLYL